MLGRAVALLFVFTASTLSIANAQRIEKQETACSTPSKQCYLQSRDELVEEIVPLVRSARLVQLIADQFIDGRTAPITPEERSTLTQYAAERRKMGDLQRNLVRLTQTIAYWGFAFASASEMEVYHQRLDFCIAGSAMATDLIYESIAYAAKSSSIGKVRSAAVGYAMSLSECDRALNQASPSGASIRLAAAVVAKCGSSRSGDCAIAAVVRDALRDARQTRDRDHQRTP